MTSGLGDWDRRETLKFNPREYSGKKAGRSTGFCEICHEMVYDRLIEEIGLGKKFDETVRLWFPVGKVRCCPPCKQQVQVEIGVMRAQIAMLKKLRRLEAEGAPQAELDAIVWGYDLTPETIERIDGLEFDELYGVKYG